jgi:lipopolysaccharide export system permease protein
MPFAFHESFVTIIDRYILQAFFKVLLVCTISLTGLFIVIDSFENLEEFVRIGKRGRGIFSVMTEYYAARMLTFFDRTSGLISMMAGIFVLTLMKRNNEIAATMAAGIPMRRILRPIVWGVFFVTTLSIVNREFVIPSQKNHLVCSVENWMGDQKSPVSSSYDFETNLFFTGQFAVAAEKKVIKPVIQLPRQFHRITDSISAEHAIFEIATDQHPAGYRFTNAVFTDAEFPTTNLANDEDVLVYVPAEHDWLNSGECFLATHISFDRLLYGDAARQFDSSIELVRGMHNPSLGFASPTRVMLHARLVQPLLDFSLLFIGLPLIINKHDRNIFVAIGMTLLVVAGFFVITLVSHGLGTFGLVSPALAAWIPMFIFLPLAWNCSYAIQ